MKPLAARLLVLGLSAMALAGCVGAPQNAGDIKPVQGLPKETPQADTKPAQGDPAQTPTKG